MVNEQTRGRGRGAVWKWVSGAWESLEGRIWTCRQRGQRKRKERGESSDRRGGEEEREGRINGSDVASSSPYRVFGGPTSLDAGGQGGTDGPKRGFLFGVGLCSTTFPILK